MVEWKELCVSLRSVDSTFLFGSNFLKKKNQFVKELMEYIYGGEYGPVSGRRE